MTEVTKKIRIDLANQGGLDFLSTIHAVQGDAYSRLVAFELYNGGEKYTPPEGTTAIVRYRKEDGTRGNYDVLPDGSSAYTINGNMLTVTLAPQVCIVPGLVQLAVGLISGNAEINTFSVRVVVQPNPGITYQSESHLKLAGTVADSGWEPNMYLGTDADGNVTALGTDKTLNQPGRAADAAKVGEAVGQLNEELTNLSKPVVEYSNEPCEYKNSEFCFKENSSPFPYAFFNRNKVKFVRDLSRATDSWIVFAEYENGIALVNANGDGYYLSYDLTTIVGFNAIPNCITDIIVSRFTHSVTISDATSTVSFTVDNLPYKNDTFKRFVIGYARNANSYSNKVLLDIYSADINGLTEDVNGLTEDVNGLTEDVDSFKNVVLHDGGAVDRNNEIVSHDYFGYTDYIEVPKWANRFMFLNKVSLGNTDYSLSNYEFATYDENKSFIGTVYGDNEIGYCCKEIDSSSVRFIRLNYGKINKDNGECIAKFLYLQNVETPTPTNQKWNNKNGNFLGDSLTEQGRFTGMMTTLYGITVNNYGKSGTTISNINASNTFSTRISGMNTSCDFVFVLGGTNDWGLSAPLGTKVDRTESTFYGGLYVVLNELRNKFPTKPIFVSTIPQRNWLNEGQSSGIDSNNNGVSVAEFNDAIIYMAHRFGCTVIDGFGESGITVNNIGTYTGDNLHFNDTGAIRFATFVKDRMELVTPY